MNARSFPEVNIVYNPPKEPMSAPCGSLPVYQTKESLVSLWRPTWRERLSVLFFGKVWLSVYCGFQPPVSVWASRTFFKLILNFPDAPQRRGYIFGKLMISTTIIVPGKNFLKEGLSADHIGRTYSARFIRLPLMEKAKGAIPARLVLVLCWRQPRTIG